NEIATVAAEQPAESENMNADASFPAIELGLENSRTTEAEGAARSPTPPPSF
ncbi:unnamed protein product, partial [Heterosigma akashiwo]